MTVQQQFELIPEKKEEEEEENHVLLIRRGPQAGKEVKLPERFELQAHALMNMLSVCLLLQPIGYVMYIRTLGSQAEPNRLHAVKRTRLELLRIL